jgi:hypothetical protein
LVDSHDAPAIGASATMPDATIPNSARCVKRRSSARSARFGAHVARTAPRWNHRPVSARSTARRAMLVLALAMPAIAAARSVVTDPVAPGVRHCGFYVDLGPKVTLPVVASAQGDVCSMEIDALGPGPHTIAVTAIVPDDSPAGFRESLPSEALVLPGAPGAGGAKAIGGLRASLRFLRAHAGWVLVLGLALVAALAVAVWQSGGVVRRRRGRPSPGGPRSPRTGSDRPARRKS